MTSWAIKLILPLVVFLMGSIPLKADVTTVYDFVKQADKAKITGAMHGKGQKVDSAGIEKDALFIHPTDKDARAEYDVTLPSVPKDGGLVMTFYAGLNDGVKKDDKESPFDGVDYAIEVDGKRLWELKGLMEHGWREGSIDLSTYAGKKIKVTFVTGSRKNSNYDWSSFGEPRVIALSSGMEVGEQVPAVKGIIRTTTAATITIRPLNASGAQISDGRTVKTDGPGVVAFDFNKERAHSIRVTATSPQNTKVYAYEPAFEITAFGPSRGVIFTGEALELRAVVRNSGEAPFTALRPLKLQLGNQENTAKTLTGLFPGEEQTIEWPWTAPARPEDGMVWMRAVPPSGGEGTSKVSGTVAVYIAPKELPTPADKAKTVKLADGSVALMNRDVMLLFLARELVVENEGSMELPAALVYARESSGWKRVGSLAPAGKLWLDKVKDAAKAKVKLSPVDGLGKASVEASVSLDKRTYYTASFSLSDNGGINFTTSADLKKGETLLVFSGPVFLAGDGAFGAEQDEALFPGLEYMVKGERSSGTYFAHPPLDNRLVPHPNKVTIPVMALRHGDTLAWMSWNPLDRWDGEHDRPAAVFASPNFVWAQENHMMGIFAPSVPDYTPENALTGKYTAAKDTKLTLSGRIDVLTGSGSVLDAVMPFVQASAGVPWLPLEGADWADAQKMCVKSLADINWVDDKKAWKHTNTGPVFFDQNIAMLLWQYASETSDPGQRENLRKMVREALEKHQPAPVIIDLAMHTGNFENALKAAGEQVQGLIRSQKPDGSWPYTPSDERHALLGRAGDTSSGWTANSAVVVLRYARMTGDHRAKQAGLKALGYLDTQIRPEGAQTWELQLHVPDILGSSRLIDAYLDGYQITGEERYLKKAVYWAKTGLPFVYFWNASDRDIMRFGTIPVFGATWFTLQQWFGVMVQWCGLDYAYQLQKLSELDKSLPWKRIAQGITVSGIQQQKYVTKDYPEDYGMYPDAYSPVKGKEEYHWDLNPHLVAKNIWRLLGQDPYAKTVMLPSTEGMTAVSTVGKDLKARMEKNSLALSVSNAPGTTTYALISGVGSPAFGVKPPVVVDGLAAPARDDLSSTGSCFDYLSDSNLLIIKMENKNPVTQVEVNF